MQENAHDKLTTKKPMKPFIQLLTGIALAASGAAQAHYLWIEPTDTGARLYYGEAEAALKEKSPGKLEVIAPNTWVQEHKTDAQGAVAINTPWRGQYVVHVLYVDKTAGEFAGKKYESLRNHFTYSFIKTDGADPGPATPPHHAAD